MERFSLIPAPKTRTSLASILSSGDCTVPTSRMSCHQTRRLTLVRTMRSQATQSFRRSRERPNQAMERTADRCTLHVGGDVDISPATHAQCVPPSVVVVWLGAAAHLAL